MDNTENSVGRLLRAARERKNLTLRAVEKAAAVSNAYLSQLESGKVKQPSPIVLHKLSELYDISYTKLMRSAGYPLPDQKRERRHSARQTGPFFDLSAAEEVELTEYLSFIRARRRRGEQ